MKKNKRSIYIILSIVAHILLLLLIQLDKDVFFNPQQSDVLPEEDRLVFELIETPDTEDQLPKVESDLVSDKNTIASDENENELTQNELPFQNGDTTLKSFNENIPEQKKQEQHIPPKQETISDIMAEIQENKTSFIEDYQARQDMQQFTKDKPEYNQELSDALEKGGMKFNTYAWDFAPYMLGLKHKVEDHINPPFAFSRLGAIDGNTLVRFKIMQDGTLHDMEILGSDAHYSLDITSTNAIQFAAPFKPLPLNFPEPYLEVTALFSYIIGNRKK
jgi:outer membrane biosynthesis protein TonB